LKERFNASNCGAYPGQKDPLSEPGYDFFLDKCQLPYGTDFHKAFLNAVASSSKDSSSGSMLIPLQVLLLHLLGRKGALGTAGILP